MQLAAQEKETQAPNVFTYSLFYVYYDQYTFISGILAQNAMLGVAGIILALQLLSSLPIALILGLCVFLVMCACVGERSIGVGFWGRCGPHSVRARAPGKAIMPMVQPFVLHSGAASVPRI